ncbi:MAG: hypothetical protein B7X11_01585, partial [Acidobacteria bacterium 37-65-4]
MAAATVAVVLTGQTHPVALLTLSAGVLACGLAGYFMHTALASLIEPRGAEAALSSDRRELLQWDKQRVLHSIKELEFDHRMGKINVKDFQTLAAPLRVHAASLIEDLDRLDAEAAAAAAVVTKASGCPKCGTSNDPDARFCKSCGEKLGKGAKGAGHEGDKSAGVKGAGAKGAVGALMLFAALGAMWPAFAAAQVSMPDPKEIAGVPVPAADVPGTKREIIKLLGCKEDEILTASGKTGEGVPEILQAVTLRVPPPTGEIEKTFRALIFDSNYD